MALGQLPPWLNITPETFLEAAKAGGAAGVQIASAQQRAVEAAMEANQRAAANAQRAAEAAAENSRRQWEFEQGLAQKAEALSAERERYAAALDETRRYHTGTLEEAAAGHAIRAAHNQALEEIARERLNQPEKPIIRSDGRGGFVQFNPDGSWKQIKEPIPTTEKPISKQQAGALLTSQAGIAGMLDTQLGPGTTEELKRIYHGTGAPSVAAGPVDVDALRTEANRAIARGKDPEAVRALFKQKTGQDL